MFQHIADLEAAWKYIIDHCTVDDAIGFGSDGEWMPCWFWFSRIKSGYAKAHFDGQIWSAHRFTYAVAHGGVIDPLLVVRHRCHRKQCVNPSHLCLGTHSDNGKDNAGRLPCGEQHKLAKLTDTKVKEMRFLAASGVSCATLAAKYGVSPGVAANAIFGKSWKHIPFQPGELEAILAHKNRHLKIISAEDILEIRRLAASGCSYTQIAKMKDLSVSGVSKIVRGDYHRDLPIDPREQALAQRLAKERFGRAQGIATPIETKIVQAVMKLASETDYPFDEIGKQTGTSAAVVHEIVHGKSWKNVHRDPGQQATALRRAYDRVHNRRRQEA